MHEHLVSVIIPCFNAADTIGKSLISVDAQAISHEIIIVDGKSTDHTKEVIRLSGVTPRVFISEPDSGVYDAINKGIERARGEWIYILGADDELSGPDALSTALQGIDTETEWIFGDIENRGRKHSRIPHRHRSSLGWQILLRNTVHQQSALYRRSLFATHKFNTTFRVLSDYDFHLTLYRRKVKFSYVPVLIAYCAASGLSKQFHAALYQEEVAIRKAHSIPVAWFAWLKYLYKKITF